LNLLGSFFDIIIPNSNIEILHLEGNNINDVVDTNNDTNDNKNENHNDDNNNNEKRIILNSLSNALSNPMTKIKELYLGSNKIHSIGAQMIARGLRYNTTLTKLYIEGNFIGDDGVCAFCVLLEEGRTNGNDNDNANYNIKDEDKDDDNKHGLALEKLWVENNGAGKDMMKRLGQALQCDGVIGDL
jgi:hypothetical protein